jgi:hypothetical protein
LFLALLSLSIKIHAGHMFNNDALCNKSTGLTCHRTLKESMVLLNVYGYNDLFYIYRLIDY